MKLIDDIRHHLAALNSGQQQREGELLLLAAAAALDKGRWIPVSERMPDHTNTVIVGDEHGVWFANRENKLAGWWDTCGGGMMENVTHWMPLPEPPQQP